MLTQIEVARMKSTFDEGPLIDANLKSDIQHIHLKDFIEKVEAKIRKSKNTLVLFLGEIS